MAQEAMIFERGSSRTPYNPRHKSASDTLKTVNMNCESIHNDVHSCVKRTSAGDEFANFLGLISSTSAARPAEGEASFWEICETVKTSEGQSQTLEQARDEVWNI